MVAASTPRLGDAPQPPPRLRVLHVEDSEVDHELITLQLQRGGLRADLHRVETVAEFQRLLWAQDWDLILSDYRLPGFTGLDALAILRGSGKLIPFIILSGEIGEDTAVDAMRQGASDYLLKDKMARLAPAIERALQTAEAQRARARSEFELAQSREQLSLLAQHLQSSIERERTAMAREIHDEVGGALTALKFDLAWMERNAQQETVVRRAHQAKELLDHALSTTQRLMLNLRPAILDQGLMPALQWLCQGFRERNEVACQLLGPDDALMLPQEIALTAFRIVQEALTNVSKHAQATEVRVDVVCAADLLSIEIHDNGKGWDAADLAKPRSFGLRGLKERALTVDGWLDLSTGEGGSSVILSVPLAPGALGGDGDESDSSDNRDDAEPQA